MSVSSINFSGDELPTKLSCPWANGTSDLYPGETGANAHRPTESLGSSMGKTQSQDVFAMRPLMESIPSGTLSPALTVAQPCAEMSMHDNEGRLDAPLPQVDAAQQQEGSNTDEDDDINLRNFMVARLHLSITDKDLRELFEPFGALERALVIIDATAGRSRGFGFVTFTEDGAGEKAMAAMHDKEVRGLKIRVSPSKQVGVVTDSASVWVRNFPVSVRRDFITGVFETFGKIVSLESQVEWSTHIKRRNKVQVVRVQYESVAVARTAIDALNGVRTMPFSKQRNLELKLPLVVRFYSEERDRPLLAPRPAAAKTAKLLAPVLPNQHHAARVSPPLPSETSGLTFAPVFGGSAGLPTILPASAVGAGMAGLVPQPFAAMQSMPGMAPMMMPMMPMPGSPVHAAGMAQPSVPFYQQLPYGTMMVPQPQVQPQYTVSPMGTVPQPPMVQYEMVAMMPPPTHAAMPQGHEMVPFPGAALCVQMPQTMQGVALTRNSSDVSPPQ